VGLTAEDAQDLIDQYNVTPGDISRDANGNEPNFMVNIDGTDWTCFYQDGAALTHKLQALTEYDLIDYIGGVGIWRLGGEDDGIWEAVTQSVTGSSAVVDPYNCSSGSVGSLLVEGDLAEVRIYPNPASSIITIEMPAGELLVVEILDISGKTVRLIQNASSQMKVDISTLSKGVYTVKVSGDHLNYTSKLLVK